MEPVRQRPRAAAVEQRLRLDAEQGLDLVPGRDECEGRDEGEHEEADPESDVRPLGGASALGPRPPAGALAPVVLLDRSGVEGRAGPRRGLRWSWRPALASWDCRQYFFSRWSLQPSGYRSNAWRRRRPRSPRPGICGSLWLRSRPRSPRRPAPIWPSCACWTRTGAWQPALVAPAGSSLGGGGGGHAWALRGGRRRRADRADPPRRGPGSCSGADRAAGARGRPRRGLGRADPGLRGVR